MRLAAVAALAAGHFKRTLVVDKSLSAKRVGLHNSFMSGCEKKESDCKKS